MTRLPLVALDIAAPPLGPAAASPNWLAEPELHFHRVPRQFRRPLRAPRMRLRPPHHRYRPRRAHA